MWVDRSRLYTAAKYSSTSGCHRCFGLNVYRPTSTAAGGAAEGEGEEESIHGYSERSRGESRWGGEWEEGARQDGKREA
jgi:hypothetical protein